jgi:quercetin dioxygenase-like cupin family protein
MTIVELADVEERRPFPGFAVRFVHSANVTLAYWDIEAGALLPEHSHPHEQVANVLEGRFELTVDGQSGVLDPGSVAIIPSHAVHSGRAVTNCRIVDVFYPIREDYRQR